MPETMTNQDLDALVSTKVGGVKRPYKCRRCGGSEYKVYPSSGFRYCPPCERASRRSWYTRNQPRVSAYRKLQKVNPNAKNYRRKWTLRRRYGVTIEQWDQMAKAQGGACAICKRAEALCVDHCHTTGCVRGLLCNKCNVGLANFRDDPKTMTMAIKYLERKPLCEPK